MIAIAIVEDDQQEQKRLQQYLMRYAMENQQTFSFALYSNALDYLEDKQKFDIVFMDIMLPNMTGMEAAARMRAYDSKTVLIFVTTMVQFAIKSYEVDALDYIVKPVNYARLTMKLQKAIRVIESNSGGTVVINDAQGMIRCSTNELLYVEVHGISWIIIQPVAFTVHTARSTIWRASCIHTILCAAMPAIWSIRSLSRKLTAAICW